MPDAVFFACQQHAPKYFWKLDYQTHANGARTIAEVVMVAADPAAIADFFAKLEGPESVRRDGADLHVATARGKISVLTPSSFAARFPGEPPDAATPRFAAATIPGVDPVAQAARLKAAGIPHRLTAHAVQVPAGAAFGMALEFTA